MINQISVQDIQLHTELDVVTNFDHSIFNYIEFDSRDVSDFENTLFICLSGQKTDGHQYIGQLIAKGVQHFLITDRNYVSEKANFYIAENAVLGFQEIAKIIRNRFQKPLVAITGSNGKTIVKEWLGQIVSAKFNICKSPKSYNSQIGVPYSVSKLTDNDLAIFETGISQLGEMEPLQQLLQPTVGIFTNIGDAHTEGFQNIEQKLQEKLKLFVSTDKVIYCSDQPLVHQTMQHNFDSKKLYSWGTYGKFKVNRVIKENKTYVHVDKDVFEVNFIDQASLENITHSIVASLVLGMDKQTIQFGLSMVKPLNMRLEIKEGRNNNLILNDSYNNDLSGLKVTLDLARKLDQEKERILILSDFANQQSDNWGIELAKLLDTIELQEVLYVGENGHNIHHKIQTFDTIKAVIEYIENKKYQNQLFIVKGARQYEFEKLVDVLELKQHTTRVEVNLSRLIQNYNYYKSLIKPKTKIMAMVKAFAYGAGIVEVSKLLELNNVDYLAVAYTDEGVLLRENGIVTPIMVMNVTLDDVDNLIKYNLEPEIYSLEQLKFFAKKRLRFHIKIDTGMHRLGFDAMSIEELFVFLETHKNIQIQSVLSHLASADKPLDDAYTMHQIDVFKQSIHRLKRVYKQPFDIHILNSAGIERFSDNQFDMVRLGIGLYGFGVLDNPKIQQVVDLKTNISQIRTLNKEETIGYNRKGTINKTSRIATIPIGYADGFDRRFSNGVGSVLINGQEAKVIGNVCMDMTMIDVTEINCKAGDEVIVYNDQLSIDLQAKKIGTISYELLTHLSERVRRIFYFE